jgi:transcriptional regulator GlxA family with amidase domain
MSPRQFLKTVRLQAARDLLETTFLSVKEVMARAGYNDPSHFVRDFEKMFGESPYRYRQHHFRLDSVPATFANRQQKPPIPIDCNPRRRSA